MTSAFLHFIAAHPFLLLALTLTLPHVLFALLVKRYQNRSGWLFLFMPLGVIAFIWGSDWNNSYVNTNGMKGTGIVLRIEPTGSRINDVQVFDYQCQIKTQQGTIVTTSFTNNGAIFYPATELWMPPAIGEEFSVKYIPEDPANFIILTNDANSSYSNKLNCTKLTDSIATAQAAYQFDPSNEAKKKTLRALLRQYIQAPCDQYMKQAYQLLLQTLDNQQQ